MFADSLSDSEWSNDSHRGWTTLVSFALQALGLGCLLLLPLLYTARIATLALLCAVARAGSTRPLLRAPRARSHPARAKQYDGRSACSLLVQIPRTVNMLTDVTRATADGRSQRSRRRPSTVDAIRGIVIGSVGDPILSASGSPPSVTHRFRT